LEQDAKYDKALRLKANILTDKKQYGEAAKMYDQLARTATWSTRMTCWTGGWCIIR
jgi:hypothetical protein